MSTQLRLEGRLADAALLPERLSEADRGRTWWIGYVWWIWTGSGWLKAIASTTKPVGAVS